MKYFFLHGLGQDSRSWDKVIKNLQGCDIDFVSPSLYDFLKNDIYEYNNLYKNFEKYINKYDEKVNLCGLSLGGLIALDYAKRNKEKVNSLVLIGVPFKIPELLFNLQTVIFKFIPKSNFEKISCSKKDFISLVDSIKNVNIESNLNDISCKTLLVCGEKDKANIGSLKKFNKKINNSEIKIVDYAGHEVNIDNSKKLAEIMKEFWQVY